jgi:hypothetical protein
MAEDPYEGYVKIGYTKDIKKRIDSLQTGNPRQLKVIWKIQCHNLYKARGIEAQLHNIFHNKRKNGEWFKISHDEISNLREQQRTARSSESFNYIRNRALKPTHTNQKYEKMFVITDEDRNEYENIENTNQEKIKEWIKENNPILGERAVSYYGDRFCQSFGLRFNLDIYLKFNKTVEKIIGRYPINDSTGYGSELIW